MPEIIQQGQCGAVGAHIDRAARGLAEGAERVGCAQQIRSAAGVPRNAKQPCEAFSMCEQDAATAKQRDGWAQGEGLG